MANSEHIRPAVALSTKAIFSPFDARAAAQSMTILDGIGGMFNYSPVSISGASTGFDWDDPYWRRKMDSTTIANIERNSLCQFWNDSNQNRESVIYWAMSTMGSPIRASFPFSSLRLP